MMLGCLLFLLPVTAQSADPGNGVRLLAQVDEYSSYNDIWGYTAPNGVEYAILGTNTGTAFYDCSVPSAPVRVGFIPGPTSQWRDMKTYGDYCYVVTEGGSGVQAINLANPANPVLVRTFGTAQVGHSHNLMIDQSTGMLYACGTPSGMPVFDLSVSPSNPPWVATYTAQYVHDGHVQHGRAHLAEIYTGRYRIVSVNSLPSFPSLSATATPGTFTHNAWADETDTLCATTDESSGGDVAIYDITNPAAPVLLSTLSPFGATVHNVILSSGRAYVSTYAAGFTCWDLANPAAPSLIGRYDTTNLKGSATVGNWGVYPFNPSGIVFASDIDHGLFVLKVDGEVIDVVHAPLADTADEQGPYPVSADLIPLGAAQPVSAKVFWHVPGVIEQSVAMTNAGGSIWTADLPGQISPAVVLYRIEAVDSDGALQRAPRSGAFLFHVGERTPIYANGFEGASDEGWTHGTLGGGDDWQRGTPRGRAEDPDHAASGLQSWGNDLGANGQNGKFLAGSHSFLDSPPIDCRGRAGVHLRFQRWLAIRARSMDEARILVNGVTVWENPSKLTAHWDEDWSLQDLDISALADGRAAVVVRFELDGSTGMTFGGWNLDDFELYSLRPSGSDGLQLTGPFSASPGQSVNYSLSSAPAVSPAWLLASRTLAFTTRFGHVFDLADPVQLIASATTDGAGVANFSVTVPLGIAGRSVHLEAAARLPGPGFAMADSNFLTLTVQ
ncbi:MAG: choice-of-anchor B family protein [Planctomycetota bacterium]|nr:choice-of-anchor B family protein [Planctomycetota bacterium]